MKSAITRVTGTARRGARQFDELTGYEAPQTSAPTFSESPVTLCRGAA